jgi:hypothetical protein
MVSCRVLGRYGVLVLGLGLLSGSAQATISYQASQPSFSTKATVTDGLILSSLITFTAGNLTTINAIACGCSDDEYIDPTTGIEFLAFNGSGTSNVAFASVTGGVLNTAANQGDSIEVIFPTGVDFGFGFTFATTFSSGDNLCVGTTLGNCSDNPFASQSGSAFVGALNDNPTPTSLSAIWLFPLNGASPNTDIQSFEVATQTTQSATPEVPTLILIGAGLVVFRLLRRRRRPLLTFSSHLHKEFSNRPWEEIS